MTRHAVVTGCPEAWWERFGLRFVESFIKHWPANVELHVCRDTDGRGPDDGRVQYHNRLKYSEGLRDFQARHALNRQAAGLEQRKGRHWKPKALAEGYNWRYDALRFSNKVFSIEMVAGLVPRGRIYWLDADVVTFAAVDPAMLDRLLPEAFALSCLDRGQYHSECGFVGYNLDHPETVPFIEAFANLYAFDGVFDLAEWHDSWVFDWLRRARNVPAHCIPHYSRHQPFVNSELGACMDHMKGGGKDVGRTKPQLMVAGHTHPYWHG